MDFKKVGTVMGSLTILALLVLAVSVQGALEEDEEYPIAPESGKKTTEEQISSVDYEIESDSELLRRLNQIDNRITTLNHTLLYNAMLYFDELNNKNFNDFNTMIYVYLNNLTVRIVAGLVGAILLAVGIVEIVKRKMAYTKRMALYTEQQTPPPQLPPPPPPPPAREQPTVEGIIKILKGDGHGR